MRLIAMLLGIASVELYIMLCERKRHGAWYSFHRRADRPWQLRRLRTAIILGTILTILLELLKL